MMKNIRECFWTTILGLILCVPAVRGQQPDPHSNPPVQPDLPLPAGDSSDKAPGETPTTPETESTPPDTRPLSGVEFLTLGQMGKRRNFLSTSFNLMAWGDTNPALSSTPSNVELTSTLLGDVALRHIWSHYEFRSEFNGGGILYNGHGEQDTPLADFAIEQRINGRRWNFLLTDRLDYLPGSFFGSSPGSVTTQGTLQTGLATLNPVTQPNQSILTTNSSEFTNTAVGEADYLIGRKSSFTASASYGILRSQQPGFVGNNNAFFSLGYNYSPNARNSFALIYTFSLFRFADQSPQLYDHIFQVAYGYRITGRLAFQLSGGPELYTITNAVTTGPGWQYSWAESSALFYDLRKSTHLGISYLTYLSGGAGVLTGARTNYVDLTVGQQLSRLWSSSLDTGFARNTPLSETTLPGTTLATFNTWYGTVTLRRPVGRHMTLSFNYSIQGQNSSTTGLCTALICGSIPARHIFGLGFIWHPQQIPVG
jgi:hypothetical protein